MKRILALSLMVAVCLANPVSNVFEIDISPEEAQRYLANPPFQEPQLSGRTGVLPLVRWNDPRFRSAEAGPTNGHYWKNGHEIENTDDYVEEVYDAQQFHGQDGLGQYAYGYSAPESAKIENREHSGDVKGSYTYRDGNNQLIKVKYWADSEGFHQEDNIPKVELQPVQETEEVRQARLAHEKAWQEAADAAKANPDPQANYNQQYSASQQQSGYQGQNYNNQPSSVPAQGYNQYQGQGSNQVPAYQAQPQAQHQSQYQGQASNQVPAYHAQPQVEQHSQYQGQASNQVPAYQAPQAHAQAYPEPEVQASNQVSAYQAHPQGAAQGYSQYQGQASGQVPAYQGQPQGQASHQSYQGQQGQGQHLDEAEPTGPPRGFFYSFTYPVSILVAKNAQGQNQPGQLTGSPVDQDTVGVNSQRYG